MMGPERDHADSANERVSADQRMVEPLASRKPTPARLSDARPSSSSIEGIVS